MITKQTCSILRGLLILALYRKQVSLINRWIKENKRRMAVFFFYLDMCFLQNFTIANTLKLYGISDKFINWWINIYKTQKCILQSIFYRFSRVYIPWSDIEWIEDRDETDFNITQNGMHKSSELWGYQQLRTQVPTERAEWRHPLFWLCLALYSLSAFQSH